MPDEADTTRQPHTRTVFRYAPVPEALLYDAGLSDKAVRVWGCLARHGMDPSACFPSHARIAGFLGCAERSVQRPLRDLEKAGWVERVPRFDGSGQRLTDGFVVHTAAQERAGTAQESAGGPRAVARGVRAEERDEGKPSNESHLTREEPKTAPAPAAAMFEEFWRAYPLKKEKGAARKAWARAAKKAAPEAIIAGAERYAAECRLKLREPRFIKHPGGWLNAERWTDEPEGSDPMRGPRWAATPEEDAADRATPAGRLVGL